MIRVLFVDDEPGFLELARAFLSRHEQEISADFESSSVRGLEKLKTGQYDVVVSDYLMPGLNGLEFLRRIREFSRIPFILLTGRGTEIIASDAINFGAYCYLRKSMDPRALFDELFRKIMKALARRRLEILYQSLIENTDDLVWEMNERTVITYINPKVQEILGYPVEELMGKKISLILGEEQRRKVDAFLCGATPAETFARTEMEISTRQGKRLTFDIKIFIIRDGSGQLLGCRGIARDITSRIEMENALREREAQLRNIFQNISDAVLIMSLSGRLLDANPVACTRYGYSGEELARMDVRDLTTDEHSHLVADRISEVEKWGTYVFNSIHMTREGIEIPVEINASLIEYKGEKAVLSIVRDVTERRRYEEQLKQSLSEKEVLLKEVHHRVKNNIQIIISLIRLQSSGLDPKAVFHFEEFEQRIRSMALVHEMLYQSVDLDSIDFSTYLERLVSDLAVSTRMDKTIRISSDIQEIHLDLNTAIPCGLIVNELITNAVKYAFAGRNEGTIRIKFSLDHEQRICHLTVQDDGVGLPPDFNPDEHQSLGMQLVQVLVNQLDGGIRFTSGEGTKIEIEFPMKKEYPWVFM